MIDESRITASSTSERATTRSNCHYRVTIGYCYTINTTRMDSRRVTWWWMMVHPQIQNAHASSLLGQKRGMVRQESIKVQARNSLRLSIHLRRTFQINSINLGYIQENRAAR